MNNTSGEGKASMTNSVAIVTVKDNSENNAVKDAKEIKPNVCTYIVKVFHVCGKSLKLKIRACY